MYYYSYRDLGLIGEPIHILKTLFGPSNLLGLDPSLCLFAFVFSF